MVKTFNPFDLKGAIEDINKGGVLGLPKKLKVKCECDENVAGDSIKCPTCKKVGCMCYEEAIERI